MTKTPLSTEELTELIVGLNRLARNLWWTWNQESQEIYQELSPRGWQNLYTNAAPWCHEVSDYELRVRLQDPDFAERVRSVLRSFENYLRRRTPGRRSMCLLFCRIRSPTLRPNSGFMKHCRLPPAGSAFWRAITR